MSESTVARESTPPDVVAALTGQHLFITGSTGFLGKLLVEKLLWSVPEVGKLSLLIRPSPDRSASQRFRHELADSPVMARLKALHGDAWESWLADKVELIAGDVGDDRFGLDDEAYDALCRHVDRVVSCAATVTFDERLDRALEVNVRGAQRCLNLARDAGGAPLLHISTCFVSGRRSGTIAERIVGSDALDARAALESLDAACGELREAGETGDGAWVAAGAREAERFGWNDVYTLTKALAERCLDDRRGTVPVAVVRPAIVESAVSEPIAGWIEDVRVCDPLLVAYGRGKTSELPGSADAALELVPVDHVVNATIAALAAMPTTVRADDAVPVYQVASRRHPISLGELMLHARDGFARTPLRDDAGEPIEVGEVRFVPPERYVAQLKARRQRVRFLQRWVPRRRTSRQRLALGSAERTLDHLIHLLDVYRPYFGHEASYEDSATRALWASLTERDQATFPFDVEGVEWSEYVSKIHVPGLVRFALRADTGSPRPEPEDEREPTSAILERAARHAADANTLYELFAATAAAYPEVTAFQTCRQGRWLRYTYREARDASANLAARLADRYGIRRGDRVVLWSSGCPEWALAALAVHRLGATIVPLDPQWPADDIAQAAMLVGARLICAAPQLAGAFAESATASPPASVSNPGCPVADLAPPFVPEPHVGLLPGAHDLGSTGAADDLASIIFTSGTTVAPKAVPLTHGNYLANVRDLVPLMELTRERLLSVLPIHHVFEQMVGWLVPMAGGSTFSYVPELKPAEISWMMATTRPTVLVAVPRLLELLHNGIRASVAAGGPMLGLVFKVLFALSRRKDGAEGHKLFSKVHRRFGGSLRRIATGGSALDPDLGRSFQLMGFRVAEGYGMTETSPVLTVNPWDAIRFGTVGKPLPGVDIDLRPPAEVGDGLAPGEGEIWVRGDNVMAGYLDDPQATAAVMRDGWLNTGDLGYFDDEGYLHVSGRSKDVIVTGAGKNVYPEEVEARYRGLPGVAELVILGLPDDGRGERVTALIVPAADADEEAIRAAIAERSKDVPSYQRVAGIELWHGDLPKTTTMKVKRTVLLRAVLDGERGSAPAAAPPAVQTDAPRWNESEAAVIETLARLTHTRPDLLRPADRLTDLGVDSLTRVELVGELEARFGVRLDDDAAAALERVEDLLAVPGTART